jgi:hypothetical protein
VKGYDKKNLEFGGCEKGSIEEAVKNYCADAGSSYS